MQVCMLITLLLIDYILANLNPTLLLDMRCSISPWIIWMPKSGSRSCLGCAWFTSNDLSFINPYIVAYSLMPLRCHRHRPSHFRCSPRWICCEHATSRAIDPRGLKVIIQTRNLCWNVYRAISWASLVSLSGEHEGYICEALIVIMRGLLWARSVQVSTDINVGYCDKRAVISMWLMECAKILSFTATHLSCLW